MKGKRAAPTRRIIEGIKQRCKQSNGGTEFVSVVIFEIFVELSRSKLFQVITTPFGILRHIIFNFGMFVFY
jgi:hypothetical protein